MTKEYMLGNAAIARGIREAGVGVVSGYPGTPSSEIVDILRAQKDRDYYLEWSVNEKVAVEVAIGAAFAGARSIVTMKHVGLNVAADPLMTVCFAGTKGGLIILAADDPSFHSSQNEQDTRRYAQFAQIPCFDPATLQDAKDMIAYAFDFSERFETPVLFRPTTRISHGKSSIELGEIKPNANQADFVKDPSRMVMMPNFARPRHTASIERQKPMAEDLEKSPWNVLELCDDSEIGVISSGIASVYAKEALHALGINASFLKITAYPMPDNLILTLLRKCAKVLIVEELEPVVEEHVRILAQQNQITTEIIGKNPVPRVNELNFEICRDVMASVFTEQADSPARTVSNPPILPNIALPPRPPALCIGCSHRSAFQVIKEVFGKNAIFPSDIGCYTLGIHSGAVDTTICMGASISIASGIAHSGEKKAICCTIGDSTFLHTGVNSLMNAVYNNAKMTVAILDNRITAMTGHQPNPNTGSTAVGVDSLPVSLETICAAVGTRFIRAVDAYDYEALKIAFREAKNFDGVSVVIVQQACAIVARKAGVRRNPFAVLPEKCKGCRKCVNFGCPAIGFDKKDAVAVVNSQCIGCGVCAQICPFDAICEVKK
ncbi:MAG: indolepyruvate ferredoxin oxidoreductase subunit alpha [Methanosarcinales archaeon]|jgi:indolepyruvate ferredoxin oxidoreductase alpha subunit|nr:indolepyruvate ferredoxin oxidoreductase subunit alpha [Methanosarcinales archaeon]